ncbi:MAG: fructokinase [Desulfomicrobiaceae bacterium]|nr:fructokinase [Desulfomicrobiaceae bacterium]
MTPPRPILFGEALFDCFPDGKRILGGAPFNVAWHLTGLGNAPLFITRVGSDAPGMEVRRAMEDWGMDTRGVQVDPTLPTGSVRITFVHGEPQYDILAHQAYDAIDDPLLPDTLRPAFLYHGSLAVRGAGQTSSRATLQTLVQKLRAPSFSTSTSAPLGGGVTTSCAGSPAHIGSSSTSTNFSTSSPKQAQQPSAPGNSSAATTSTP